MCEGRREATQLLNTLANEPANLAALGYEWADLSPFFDRPGNLAIGDERGVALFAEISPGVYEGHYLFSSTVRGPEALQIAREMVSRLFTLRDAKAIVGHTPAENRPARLFSNALGFTRLGVSVNQDGRSCVDFRLERSQWEALSAEP